MAVTALARVQSVVLAATKTLARMMEKKSGARSGAIQVKRVVAAHQLHLRALPLVDRAAQERECLSLARRLPHRRRPRRRPSFLRAAAPRRRIALLEQQGQRRPPQGDSCSGRPRRSRTLQHPMPLRPLVQVLLHHPLCLAEQPSTQNLEALQLAQKCPPPSPPRPHPPHHRLRLVLLQPRRLQQHRTRRRLPRSALSPSALRSPAQLHRARHLFL